MSSSGRLALARVRVVAALTAAVVGWLAVSAAGASAATLTADCAGLQTALTNAAGDDVITLDQL